MYYYISLEYTIKEVQEDQEIESKWDTWVSDINLLGKDVTTIKKM